MLSKLVGLASVASATWNPALVNITTSWPGNDQRPAGALVQFDSPAGQISGGNGTCEVAITTAGVSFVSFFNAHVLPYNPTKQAYEITGGGADWQDQGFFDFIVFADDEPADGDITVSCQDDSPLDEGTIVLSSFPNDFPVDNARGSFTKIGSAGWPSEVILSFDTGFAPQNFTMDDPRLLVTEQSDSFVISGLDQVNYNDVWFSLGFEEGKTVASYDIQVNVTP